MEKFYALADKYKFIGKICGFQRTVWYALVFAFLAALACSFDLDVVLIYFISASTTFAALFNRDFKPVIVAFFLTYFSLGLHMDINSVTLSNYTIGHTTADLVQLIICAGVMVAAVIFRLAKGGQLKKGLKPHAFTVGILAMCTAFLLNGLFYPGYVGINIIVGLILLAGFAVVYYIMLCGMENESGLIGYICKLCLICAGLIVLELMILAVKLGATGMLIDIEHGGIDRDHLLLGWGVNNLIGGALSIFIAPTVYLAFSAKKFSWLYIVAAAGILGAVLFTQCRSALLVGAVIFVIGLAICCFAGNNRFSSRIAAAAIGAAAVVALIILGATGYLGTLFAHLSGADGQSADISNFRFDIWQVSWENFLKNPIFGAGFGENVYPDWHPNYGTTFYLQNMSHNIAVEFLGACGVVGVLAFGYHLYELVRFYIVKHTVKERDWGRIFIGLALVTIIGTSLLDNFFFYPCISIFYTTMLAASERQCTIDNVQCTNKDNKNCTL